MRQRELSTDQIFRTGRYFPKQLGDLVMVCRIDRYCRSILWSAKIFRPLVMVMAPAACVMYEEAGFADEVVVIFGERLRRLSQYASVAKRSSYEQAAGYVIDADLAS